MTYDVREIANFVLDEADGRGVPVTNVFINKIVYFLHGFYLAEKSEPLVRAKIEAWTYGPVFREVYSEFKSFGRNNITTRAQRVNIDTGEKVVCEPNIQPADRDFLRKWLEPLLKMNAFDLVGWSYEHDGPWHKVYYHEGLTNPGMAISNDLIIQHFVKACKH